MNIVIIIIAVLLLAARKNGGVGGGGGGGGTPPPPPPPAPDPCDSSKFARMQAYIWGLKRIYRNYVDLKMRNPAVAAILEREYGDCRGWNNW